MVRTPSCDKNGLRKGTWTAEEDKKLIAYVTRYGCWNWRQLPKFAGLQRCGKSCRLRWMNYLRPNIKRGNFTQEEEEIIIRMHSKLGNRWSTIATHLSGRTDNEIKNHWHTSLKRRFQQNTASNEKTNNELSNNVALQVTLPTTSQISDSTTCSISPLSSSSTSELSSTISWDNKNEKLVIEDYDFPFLDDAFWTETELTTDISYNNPPSEIVSDDCINGAFQSLDTIQILDALPPEYQSSSESMFLDSDFGFGSFVDAQIEVTGDNFWTQPNVPDVCQLLTPLEVGFEYFSPDFWS